MEGRSYPENKHFGVMHTVSRVGSQMRDGTLLLFLRVIQAWTVLRVKLVLRV